MYSREHLVRLELIKIKRKEVWMVEKIVDDRKKN
jgi:hypothetical protein